MKFVQQNYARFFYGFLLIIGLGWIWLSAAPASAITGGKIPAPQTGFLAPDFTAKTIEGKTVGLSDLRGKVVLINIWASWCPPCRAEMPAIEHTYQSFKDNGFVVLAVDSTVQDTAANAQAFVSENQFSFPILMDETGEITRLYRVQSLPTSFFIGRDGIIREVVVGGPMAQALLSSRVEKLLKEMP
jgi:cytochrome c biogenesis protein CcmG, thiol:disulfide interchange protein DsbE